MVAIATPDFDKLSNHLAEKSRHNMHSRKTRTINKVRVLEYVNLMKSLSLTLIKGHVAGSGIDFEYELRREAAGGVFHIIRNAYSFEGALKILEKEKKLMLARIATDTGDPHPVNYKEGEFYVNRCSAGGKITPALTEAVARGVFPKTLVKSILAWNFKVIKGQPKRKL